jgi:hypothetical protein
MTNSPHPRGATPIRRLLRTVRATRQGRLLRDLHRNAAWASQARATPTLCAWANNSGNPQAPRPSPTPTTHQPGYPRSRSPPQRPQ